MKKILSLILTAAMLMSAVVMTAGAENIGTDVYAPMMPTITEADEIQVLDENQVDAQGIYYSLDAESMTAIVGKNTYADSASADAGLKTDSIVIPAKVVFGENEYIVIAVGRNAFDGTDIREIAVECETIGEFAFAGCTKLEYAFVATNDIKGFAFWGCTALTEVFVASAHTIGGGAFWNCSNLTSVSLMASTIMEKAFEGCDLDYIVFGGDAPAVAAGALGNTKTAYIFAGSTGYEDFPIPTEVMTAPIIAVENVYGKPGETVEVSIYAPAGIDVEEIEISIDLAEGLTVSDVIFGTENLCYFTDAKYDAGKLTGTVIRGICGTLAVLKITLPEDASGVYGISAIVEGYSYNVGGITVCDHAETKTVTVKAASCDEAGVENTVCTACGEVLSTADVEAKGHSYKDFVIAPTCTEGGYTRHICDCCSDAYTDAETDALGHAWDEGNVKVEASTSKEGLVTYTCTACGTTKDVKIPKIMYGDADGNGKINISDASITLKYIAKWSLEDGAFNAVNANVNGDEKINLGDVSLLLKKIAKWDVELGPKK